MKYPPQLNFCFAAWPHLLTDISNAVLWHRLGAFKPAEDLFLDHLGLELTSSVKQLFYITNFHKSVINQP